jgi:5-hydroxyisourate hydrolase
MATLTTHVLNIATGTPAAGMRVELRVLSDGSSAPPTISQTNADGRCSAPLLEGAAFRAGRYSLTFHVAAYFRSLKVPLADPPFLDEVVIAFGIADAWQNYHVPLLVSPWSYSTYRGS